MSLWWEENVNVPPHFVEAYVEHAYTCACEEFDLPDEPAEQITDYFAFRNVTLTDQDFLLSLVSAYNREKIAGGGPFTAAALWVEVSVCE
jgi:hypothetical protein